jgi:hypothetical protein
MRLARPADTQAALEEAAMTVAVVTLEAAPRASLHTGRLTHTRQDVREDMLLD